MFNLSLCGNNYNGWWWRNNSKISVEEERIRLANLEREQGHKFPNESRVIPYLVEPDISQCYPKCDDST